MELPLGRQARLVEGVGGNAVFFGGGVGHCLHIPQVREQLIFMKG